MHRIIGFVPLVCALMVGGCGGSQVVENDADAGGSPAEVGGEAIDLAQANEITLWIEGMGCPMCATNVEYELEELGGVADARINLKLGTAYVTLAGATRPTREELATAVADSGLTLSKIAIER